MLPRVSIYNMQNMVTDMTFHQTENTFQYGSHFGWHKDNPHRSPWMCLDTKSMSVRRGSAPHCWKAKACDLTLIWYGTGRITNRGLQQQWKISSSERTYKSCLHQQHSRSKSGKLHSWFWGASAHAACVLYLDLSPDQLQPGPVHRRPMSKSECQRQTWSTILLCSFIRTKTHSLTLESLCNVNPSMVNMVRKYAVMQVPALDYITGLGTALETDIGAAVFEVWVREHLMQT